MNSKMKSHLYCLLCYVLSILIIDFLLSNLLLTLVNAFIESDYIAIGVTQLIMRILVPLIAYFMIYRYKIQNTEIRREFISATKDKEYSIKGDISDILHSKDFWGEMIYIFSATLVFWLINMRAFWILINIPMIFVLEMLGTLHMHGIWQKERAS